MLITGPHGDPVELDELDPAGLLAVLGDNQRTARAADRDRLRLVHQWCVLHPARHDPHGETEIATFDPSGLPGVLGADESLGGDGCPPVAAFTPEPLAAALGLGKVAAKQLIADTLDLHHRLPRCWRRVQRLEVDTWKARRIAQLTHPLSQAAAAEVDAALAPVLPSCSWAAIDRAVAAALATHHPDLLAAKTRQGKDAWEVTLTHPGATDFTGTSWLTATGDTLAFTAFEDRLSEIAADLAAAGDTDPLGARKAKAIGILAGQDPTGPEADLLTLTHNTGTGTDTGPAGRPRRSRKPRTHLFLHYSLTDLLGLGADDDHIAGRVEGHGHVLEPTLQAWVATSETTITPVLDPHPHPDHEPTAATPQAPGRLDPALVEAITAWITTGHTGTGTGTHNPDATITGILDLGRDWSVDGHDAPDAMREQVIQRNPHCVFPWCTHPARRADLDHTEPYVPLDEGGPPGQTAPDKIAPLCRRHHRCKTTGRWRYRRLPDGSYHWTDPHGRHYLVTPTGTTELDPS